MGKGIWVFAEQEDGKVRKVTFEILSNVRKIADAKGEQLAAVGADIRDAVRDRRGRGGAVADLAFPAHGELLGQRAAGDPGVQGVAAEHGPFGGGGGAGRRG